LVINDDHDLLGVYDAVIRDMGHQPVTRVHVGSAVEIVRDVKADALIVDLESPADGEAGIRIIREVRAHPAIAGLPIILCTGATQKVKPLLKRQQLTDVPVVGKPFAVDELEAVLQAVLSPERQPQPTPASRQDPIG
jgi:DNA-binding response OmpR family regulator